MSDVDRRLDAFCHEEAGTILALLERLVAIQSGTSNKAGVDAVAALMAGELEAVGFTVERHRREACGDHLVARRGAEEHPSVLLVGHTDTVFPPEDHRPAFHVDGERCMGQGVIDMKGGLACLVTALRALEATASLRGGHERRVGAQGRELRPAPQRAHVQRDLHVGRACPAARVPAGRAFPALDDVRQDRRPATGLRIAGHDRPAGHVVRRPPVHEVRGVLGVHPLVAGRAEGQQPDA